MIVAVVFILTTGGVIILRPLAKRAGELIDLYTRDKQSGLEGEVRQMRDLLRQQAGPHLIVLHNEAQADPEHLADSLVADLAQLTIVQVRT